ncbi:MAG: DnaJ C-terminal domain-containing protein [Myxococcota bacterium]|nr:DnaJ C-terminal domain-containing protein [Myxococcota bacterium]
MRFVDYYDVLGVARNASQAEIKKAFRRESRKVHPDVNSDPGAEDKFKALNEAYEVLKDPKARKQYDVMGSNYRHGQNVSPPPGWQNINFDFGGFGGAAPQGGAAGSGSSFSDFFEAFFGARGGGGRTGYGPAGAVARDGQDTEMEFCVSVEDAYHCVTKKVVLEAVGLVGRSKSYDVKLPPGTTVGTRIRLPKAGEKGQAGGKNGDLLLNVVMEKHPRFEVQVYDLLGKLPITPWEAALGAKVSYETVAGTIQLNIPAGSQSGQHLRLKEKGLPDSSGGRGSLLLALEILVPRELSAQERVAFEMLADCSNFDPRSV